MKQQKLIAEEILCVWRKLVNQHLENGWTVVPTTLSTCVSVSRNDTGNTSQAHAYVIIVEKELEVEE